jgi:hypothetical protein
MSNSDYKDREIEFQFDDVDNIVYFEGCDEHTLTEEFMTHLFKQLRKHHWFFEGNKTEGIVTFHSELELTIDWKTIEMGDDWDTDQEEEHKQDILLNMDPSQWFVLNYND